MLLGVPVRVHDEWRPHRGFVWRLGPMPAWSGSRLWSLWHLELLPRAGHARPHDLIRIARTQHAALAVR